MSQFLVWKVSDLVGGQPDGETVWNQNVFKIKSEIEMSSKSKVWNLNCLRNQKYEIKIVFEIKSMKSQCLRNEKYEIKMSSKSKVLNQNCLRNQKYYLCGSMYDNTIVCPHIKPRAVLWINCQVITMHLHLSYRTVFMLKVMRKMRKYIMRNISWSI